MAALLGLIAYGFVLKYLSVNMLLTNIHLKGSVHKPDKCSMCSFGKTRLKFTRFSLRDVFLQVLGLPM